MRAIGIVSTVIAGLVVAFGLVVGLRALPDVRRYLRIRSM